MQTVLKRSAEAQATEILRNQIVSGSIESGARLTEVRLAERLAVSRATVRSALHQLAVEGLVIQTPYTGWSVTSLTSKDAWELYTVRASLEGLAARLAASSLDELGRAELKTSFKGLVHASRKGSLAKTTAADFSLHKTIVRLAKHGRLAEQYRLVEQQIRVSIGSTNSLLTDLSQVIAQHEPIVESILKGRGVDAAKYSETHAVSEGERLHAHLAAQERENQNSSSRSAR